VNGMVCFAVNRFLPTVQGPRISKILRQSSQDVKEGGTELSKEPTQLPALPTNGRLAEHHLLSWKTVLTTSECGLGEKLQSVPLRISGGRFNCDRNEDKKWINFSTHSAPCFGKPSYVDWLIVY
jgi:hypothetical protein